MSGSISTLSQVCSSARELLNALPIPRGGREGVFKMDTTTILMGDIKQAASGL